ncbi:hypothetical protein ACN27G_07940 [Plantactinospora sp. WMMB334]|uniref:hypothetical protein n=1 Tax=Plantactinospora sp. WMMB334 TaxID=3404119 RepID=UPI003B9565AF
MNRPARPVAQPRKAARGMNVAPDREVYRWRGLLLAGGWAALGSVAVTVVQISILAAWPPPETAPEFFELMLRSPLLGLVSMDGLYLINNLMVLLVYLALAVPLWTASRSAVALVLTLGFLQMAAYNASNSAAEMLMLARTHDRTEAPERAAVEAAGEALLARWNGTAFLLRARSTLTPRSDASSPPHSSRPTPPGIGGLPGPDPSGSPPSRPAPPNPPDSRLPLVGP